MKSDQVNLTREAEVLHRQFFRRDVPQGFIDEYLKAHAELADMAQVSDSELRTVNIVIEKELDALGIEPWLRTGSKRHLLTRKLLLISYLAECDATHLELRQEIIGRVRSITRLCISGVWGIIRLINGRIQKAFYGLL